MTTHHTLDDAISYATHPSMVRTPESSVASRIGILAECAGAAAAAPDLNAHRDLPLALTAGYAMRWADALTHGDESLESAALAVRHEYNRAHVKHNGNTPYNPAMSDDDRAAILLEEVGEVARALTPDADTEVGHAGNLRDELIQTATMALAWLARLLDNQEATR